MLAVEIAIGVAAGITLANGAKIVMISAAKARDRRALRNDLEEVATGFIDKMHSDLMAERAAEEAKAAKRRKPATKKAPVKKPVATAKKTVTTKKGK